jgi:hypothetical protein
MTFFETKRSTTMAYGRKHRRKSVSRGYGALFAVLTLRTVAAFSTLMRRYTRMSRQQHFLASSQAPYHNLIELGMATDESESIESYPESPSVIALIPDLFGIYSDLLKTRPYLTNGITAGLLAVAGDYVAQSESIYVAHAAMSVTIPYNGARTLTFALTGLLFEGPWIYFWYESLWKMGSWMESNYKAGPRLQVATQIFVDQTIGVFIYFPLYFMVYECIGAFISGRGKREETACFCWIVMISDSIVTNSVLCPPNLSF